MSKYHNEIVTCPKCQKESVFKMWDSINTMIDTDMKEKVRTNEAFTFNCPYCGNKAILNYSTLYHQMEDRIMIYHITGDPTEAINILSNENSIHTGLLKNYKKRVVCTLDDFREKLFIFDQNLDDRVIELMKIYIVYTLKNTSPDIAIRQIFFETEAGGNRIFKINTESDGWLSTDYQQEVYDFITDKFKKYLKEEKEVVINLNWALKVMEQ